MNRNQWKVSLSFAAMVAGCGYSGEEAEISQSTQGLFSLNPNAVYQIKSAATGKCIGIVNNSTANGAAAEARACNGAAGQSFSIASVASGYYAIKNTTSLKCLDVTGKSTADGAAVIQYTCNNGSTNQQWAIADASAGMFRLTSRNSGKVMEVSLGATADGTPIVQRKWNGATYQQFQLYTGGGGAGGTGGTPGTGGVGGSGGSGGSGSCVSGSSCQPPNPCRVGAVACNTGTPVCVETGSQANGASCGSGKVCSSGSCQTGCWIGGAFVSSGAANPANACQVCNPTKSATGWSNNDGAVAPCGSCGGTAACANGTLGPCSKNTTTYYQDHDGDGYGNALVPPVVACSAPSGWVAQAGDCDDNDFTDKPGATECESYDPNVLTTCSSSGSWVTSTCAHGCAGGQCRTFPFPTVSVAGSVTCGNLQCPASQGCSFGGGWSGQPACGSPFKYYHATCDGQNDCPSGQQCCWIFSGGSDAGVGCFPSGTCPHFQMGSNAYLVCDPNQANSCPAGSTCTMLSPYSAYYCQPN